MQSGANAPTESVLARGVGPSLSAFGLASVAPDPALQLATFPGGTPVAQNDNWAGDPTVIAADALTGAFPFASATSLDAALVGRLSPGSYSATVSSATSGMALVELYDASGMGGAGYPQLVNLSTRAQVGNGSEHAVGRLDRRRNRVADGLSPRRGSHADRFWWVAAALADPQITVYDSTGAAVAGERQLGRRRQCGSHRQFCWSLPRSRAPPARTPRWS